MTLLRNAVVFFFGLSIAAHGQEKKAALDVVQAELSICVAYYTFVRGCAIEKSEINAATAATANADKMRRFAFQAGQALNMDNDALLSRQKIALEQQGKLLEGSCENIKRLDDTYGPRCKTLSDDPQAVLDQYLKR